jgi:hypothetical protein
MLQNHYRDNRYDSFTLNQEETMRTQMIAISIAATLVAVLLSAPPLHAANEVFTAKLLGDSEVPPINSNGKADFKMEIVGNTITFTLTYSGLSASPAVAHLHFAPTKVAGGIMIFLCGGGNQPNCPAATSGTITGTIVAANVVGPAAQGIAAGDLTSALEAVDEGLSYANIHTANFPAGEIRGQVTRSKRGHDD